MYIYIYLSIYTNINMTKCQYQQCKRVLITRVERIKHIYIARIKYIYIFIYMLINFSTYAFVLPNPLVLLLMKLKVCRNGCGIPDETTKLGKSFLRRPL